MTFFSFACLISSSSVCDEITSLTVIQTGGLFNESDYPLIQGVEIIYITKSEELDIIPNLTFNKIPNQATYIGGNSFSILNVHLILEEDSAGEHLLMRKTKMSPTRL
jgi:hypothetical protein